MLPWLAEASEDVHPVCSGHQKYGSAPESSCRHPAQHVKIHDEEDPLSCSCPSPMASCWAQTKLDGDTEFFESCPRIQWDRDSQHDLLWHIAISNASAPVS